MTLELSDTDYQILRLVKRRGPLDSTAIKSRLVKFGVTDQRLRELSHRPRFYAGPESLADNRLLICSDASGDSVYSLAPLGVQALNAHRHQRVKGFCDKLLFPALVVILGGLALYVLQRFLPL